MKNRRGIFILINITLAAILLWIATRQWLLPLLPAQNRSLEDIKTLTDITFGAITTICTVAALYISLTKEEKTAGKVSPEPIDPRSRRIMLDHVEEFWIHGILEKSLHGAALLDLGLKEDPEALDYPWTIRREANQDPLPLGKPMLEIFKEIGLGRSLLILGAPGSGKTTMLLELARQLIERARQDDSEPIPVVVNLSSWNEKQSLADWLAAELNSFYSVSKKLAPAWVAGEGMLLLLDGLDEVKAEHRDKCVAAINRFRTDHGLVGMALCSRSEEYAELETKLAFNGAIEIQPLTSDQVTVYFNHLGPQMNGVRQVLQKDTVLSEMAQSPLFLSIMTLAYRDTPAADILVSQNIEIQRKHLFDSYIARMFTRPERSKRSHFEHSEVLRWLSWLAKKMIVHNQVPYLLERMQSDWLISTNQLKTYKWIFGLLVGLLSGLLSGLLVGLLVGLFFGLTNRLLVGLLFGLLYGLLFGLRSIVKIKIKTVDSLEWNWQEAKKWLLFGLLFGLLGGLLFGLIFGLISGLLFGLLVGLLFGLLYIGLSLIQHYTLRFILARNHLLPWDLVPFLNHCTDLIFLRRVGGGYIFVHRLLMEHFAAMYPEIE